MNPISNPFEKLLVGLVKSGVDFITVGGLACAFNGYLRATEDVDILVKRSPENLKKLLGFLSLYGEGFAKELTEADFTDEEGAIRVIEDFPIDIFTMMGGDRLEDLERFRDTIQVQDVSIPYLNAEGLIRLKSRSVRERDRNDLTHLKFLKKS